MTATAPSRHPLGAVLGRVQQARRRALRLILLHRRALAAASAALAVLVGVQAVAPPPPATTRVWTFAADLDAGTVLAPGDLVPSDYPPTLVPHGAAPDPRRLLGRPLAAPVLRGEPLTEQRVISRGLLAAYPGRTAVPVRVTDAAVVRLLRVGDRVTLVAVDPDAHAPPTPIARDVPVLALPRPDTGVESAGSPGRLVVVAVASDAATDVAGRAVSGLITVVWED